MKTHNLTIAFIRHGAANSYSREGNDINRTLSEKGVADVIKTMKHYTLSSEFVMPSVIFTSPALRARSTASIVAEACGFPHEMIFDEPLIYNADSALTLVSFIRKMNSDFKNVLIAGHFPIIPETVELLTKNNVISYGTSTLTLLGSDGDNWEDACGGTFEKLFYFDPAICGTQGN